MALSKGLVMSKVLKASSKGVEDYPRASHVPTHAERRKVKVKVKSFPFITVGVKGPLPLKVSFIGATQCFELITYHVMLKGITMYLLSHQVVISGY